MKLHKLGPNETEVRFSSGLTVLVSYSTPVAATLVDGTTIRTAHKWSVTTSKHINRWLGSCKATIVPQSQLDTLLG